MSLHEQQTVKFARINRRNETLSEDREDFYSELKKVIEPGNPTDVNVPKGKKRKYEFWQINTTEDHEFITGFFGFTEPIKSFETSETGKLKRTSSETNHLIEQNLIPFAIQTTDEKGRYLAYGTSKAIQAATFLKAFSQVININRKKDNPLAQEWEVDTVSLTQGLTEWLTKITVLTSVDRVIRLSNPGNSFDKERDAMKELGVTKKHEILTTSQKEGIDAKSPYFKEKLAGLETGDLDIELVGRDDQSRTLKWNSQANQAGGTIPRSIGSDEKAREIVKILKNFIKDLPRRK